MQSFFKAVELEGGVTLPYVEQGETDGIPVIFLHGVTDSHHSWNLVRSYLPEAIRAFAITQRGHGEASKPRSVYDANEFAEDIRKFMDAVGLETASIVGHSLGSFVAQRFAIDNPDRVDSLTLIGSFATCMDNAGVIEFTAIDIDGLRDPVSLEFAAEFQSSTLTKAIDPDFFALVVDESTRVPAFVWKSVFENLLATDHTDELSFIEAKTLLIWGDQDAYFGHADQVRLLEGIRDVQLKVYPGIGHAPNWECPEEVAADVSAFVMKHSKRAVRDLVTV